MKVQLGLIVIYLIGNLKALLDPLEAVLRSNLLFPMENMTDNASPMTRSGRAQLPRRFDLRDEWGGKCLSLTLIYDQGTCGSCWAFGTANAMSDRICIQS